MPRGIIKGTPCAHALAPGTPSSGTPRRQKKRKRKLFFYIKNGLKKKLKKEKKKKKEKEKMKKEKKEKEPRIKAKAQSDTPKAFPEMSKLVYGAITTVEGADAVRYEKREAMQAERGPRAATVRIRSSPIPIPIPIQAKLSPSPRVRVNLSAAFDAALAAKTEG